MFLLRSCLTLAGALALAPSELDPGDVLDRLVLGDVGALDVVHVGVVEPISVECEYHLAMTPFGELRHSLCDVFLFESSSKEQELLQRLDARAVKA